MLEAPRGPAKEVSSLTAESVPQGTKNEGAPNEVQDGAPIATPAYCELVAGDLGIKPSAARTAFLNEPTHRVLGVVGWALDKSEDPVERSRMVIAWPGGAGRGRFVRPPTSTSRWQAAWVAGRRRTTGRTRR